MDVEVFAMRLRELMDERGWNNSRVIYACEGEISNKTVERWLSGANAPSSENLARLADAFGVTTDYLLGRSDWDGQERRDRESWSEKERARKLAAPAEAAEEPPVPRPRRRRRSEPNSG
jgi:transcriptional regulator with XRE-family HTH domain